MNLERDLDILFRQHLFFYFENFEEYEVLLAEFERGALLLLFTFVSD